MVESFFPFFFFSRPSRREDSIVISVAIDGHVDYFENYFLGWLELELVFGYIYIYIGIVSMLDDDLGIFGDETVFSSFFLF